MRLYEKLPIQKSLSLYFIHFDLLFYEVKPSTIACYENNGGQMKKLKNELVSFFNDKPVAALIVLVCFVLSSCATFTGFLDLMS